MRIRIRDPDRSLPDCEVTRCRPNRHLVGNPARFGIDQSDRVPIHVNERLRAPGAQREDETRADTDGHENRPDRDQSSVTSDARTRDRNLRGLSKPVFEARIGRRCLLGPQRPKVVGQAFCNKLEDPFRPIEILQPMLAQVTQLRFGKLVVAEHRTGRLRDEDLAPVTGRHDPRSAMDAQTVIALLGLSGLARVDPHAHAQLDPHRPVMRGQRPLGRDRG